MLKKIISFVLSGTLIISQPIFAQGVAQINIGNYLRTVGSSMAMDKFRPLHMRYFSYDMATDNFQLLLDKGDNKDIKEGELEEKTRVLMDYFKIGLSLPNEKFWVNLRPDAQDQIIDPELEKTDIGRIMLEADLQLKKDTSGMTSPQTPEGKAYWEKLYKKAGELFGSENITIPTITRPWIVPGEIILRQGEDSAYIFKANMKVMLESDYLNSRQSSVSGPGSSVSGLRSEDIKDPRIKELNEYSSQLIRELIIPKLTKEVNSSKRYAPLRQVFFSLVMARWFKERFNCPRSIVHSPQKEKGLIQLINKGDLTGLTSKEPWSKSYYFNEYKKSFSEGEYNLKEQVATSTGQVIRSYRSGGGDIRKIVITGRYNTDNTGDTSASPLKISNFFRALKSLLYRGEPKAKLSEVEDVIYAYLSKLGILDYDETYKAYSIKTSWTGKPFNISHAIVLQYDYESDRLKAIEVAIGIALRRKRAC